MHERQMIHVGMLLLIILLASSCGFNSAEGQPVSRPTQLRAWEPQLDGQQDLTSAWRRELVPTAFSFLTGPPPNLNATCNATLQESALRQLYNTSGGATWANQYGWNTSNLSCPKNGIEQPSYCCWYGVSCCLNPSPCVFTSRDRRTCDCTVLGMVTQLRLSRNNLAGNLDEDLLAWLGCELNFIDFSFNYLNGTIDDSIANLTNIKTLSLGNNQFSGTLTAKLKSLPQLQVLDLTNNQMTGSIPSDLCNDNNTTNLTDLLLANNQFSGNYSIAACNNLVALDVTANNLSGSLPNFTGYDMLHIALMSRNNFIGSIPGDVNAAPLLMNLDVSQNNLIGTIPFKTMELQLLSYVRMKRNGLTGTIPENLFLDLGSLVRMDLSNNLLTGTIPPVDPNLATVVVMDLSNNSLVGTIPESFSVFAEPTVVVNLQLNLLSCCGTDPKTGADALNATLTADAYGGMNYTLAANTSHLLPSFLSFTQYLIPVPADRTGVSTTNMRCPDVVKSNDSVDQLQWNIDPSYFLYHNCDCEAGYQLVNTTLPGKLWHFTCESIDVPWYVKYPWIVALAVVGATLIIIAFLFLVCYRKGAKPAFLQQYVNMRKRLKGEPKDGVITVVTTDIEGYSDLMKREPELMGKGLRIHNYCIDKARWQFFGYTMEQEGDSFILAFYDPFDAVAFCLQAQLLLQRVEWPERLLNAEGGAERVQKGGVLTQALGHVGRLLAREKTERIVIKSPGSRGGGISTEGSGTLSGEVRPSIGSRTLRSLLGQSHRYKSGAIPEVNPVHAPVVSIDIARHNTAATSTLGVPSPASSPGPSSHSSRPNNITAPRTSLQGSLRRPATQSNLANAGPQSSLANAGSQPSLANASPQNSLASAGPQPSLANPAPPNSVASADPQPSLVIAAPQNSLAHPANSIVHGSAEPVPVAPEPEVAQFLDSTSGIRMSPGGLNGMDSSGVRISGGPTGLNAHRNVFNGLRVRMGVATGKLDKSTTLRSSAIMERSKVVSDAAAGGQVLMDQDTFHEVKARLVELGAVDHNGLSVDKMNLSKPTLLSYMLGRGRNRGTDEAEIAVVLDMGRYVQLVASKISNFFSNACNVMSGTQAVAPSQGSAASLKTLDLSAKGVAPVEDGPLAGCVDASAQCLHLYQIVSPALVERVHRFGSKLALKDDWICVDQPYFNAPGAAAAALGLDASSSIPAITMVFCMVDGAKDWKPLHDKAKRLPVQRIMRDVLVNTLMAVRGGYMCRMQEDEFKYMACFPTPEEAAKWCLLMQDGLMWQDWPDWLLKMETAKVQLDDRGNTVFRGPRLRMGMCHGVPRAIVPDHMGRADYHGASINSAARYMDATAHGGQVVCELATAMSIISHWNGNSSFTTSLGVTTPGPVPPGAAGGGSITMQLTPSGDAGQAAGGDPPTPTANLPAYEWQGSSAHSLPPQQPAAPSTADARGSSGPGPISSTPFATEALHAPAQSLSGPGVPAKDASLQSVSVDTMVESLRNNNTAAGQDATRPTLPQPPHTGVAGEQTSQIASVLAADRTNAGLLPPVTHGRISAMSNGPTASTYCTSVTVLRMGGYMFKGNPDEIPMAQLLLEGHLQRQFPDDPPKGKGCRTSIASGTAGVASNVEMPSIARRYYQAWCSKHETPLAASTPRGGPATATKGWHTNLLTASRSHQGYQQRSGDMDKEQPGQSQTSTLGRMQSGQGTGAGQRRDMRNGMQDIVRSSRGTIRDQFVGLVHLGSRRATGGSTTGDPHDASQPRSPRSDGAGQV